MDLHEKTSHVSKSQARLLVILVWMIVLAVGGCSEKRKSLSEIRESFAQKDYEETELLCQHALRKNIHDPEVYYYYGLALLEQGRDYEAFRRLEEAGTADPMIRGKIAGRLLVKGREAFARGGARRAADRLKLAVNMQPDLELGSLKYLVADAYFDERVFDKAAPLYVAAIDERPDTAAAESAYFNLSVCYVALGDSTGALQALDELLDRFPKGRLAGRARWELVNLMYEHASAEFARGNYEAVVEEINTLLERTTNVSLLQRARFILGEAYERLEDYPNAYEQYKTIIEQDSGASGRIIERARQKINALRDSGLL